MNIQSLEEGALCVMLESRRLKRKIRAGETGAQYVALPDADKYRWIYSGSLVVVDDRDVTDVIIIQGGDCYLLPIGPGGDVPLATYYKPIGIVGGVTRD